jgi:hypothetical protein
VESKLVRESVICGCAEAATETRRAKMANENVFNIGDFLLRFLDPGKYNM